MIRPIVAALVALLASSCTSTPPAKDEVIIPVEEYAGIPYVRRDYGGWIDADRDCQDTRQEVLIAESTVPVTFKTDRGCKVALGRWEAPFSARVFTDPSKLDIDHLVPLAEAHRSGAWKWNKAKKKAYANDLSYPYHLIAVSARENRRKGDRDPKAYMPPNIWFVCRYQVEWINVKQRWGLTVDKEELAALQKSFDEICTEH